MKRKRRLGFKAGVGICLIIVGLLLLLGRLGYGIINEIKDDTEPVDTSAAENISRGSLDVERLGDLGTRIVNHQDGYEFQTSWTYAGNVSLTPLELEIDRGNKIYKIYTEDLETSQGVADYVAYSGKFLDNQSDHIVQPTQTLYYNNHKVTVNAWTRNRLGAAEDLGEEVESVNENDMKQKTHSR